MRHFRSLDDVHLGDCWLTIGSFDGVHRGHQAIVSDLITEARENVAPAVLVTFYPHPVTVLRGQNFPYYLSSPEEKAECLREYADAHQSMQKVRSDWPALTTALELIANGRLALGTEKKHFDEWRTVYIKENDEWKPLPYDGFQVGGE